MGNRFIIIEYKKELICAWVSITFGKISFIRIEWMDDLP